MIENGFKGNLYYKAWLLFLFCIAANGLYHYNRQISEGLGITGMSRDISWGFYVSNFTFLVGIAASAVMLVIPYYIHHYKKFHRAALYGEWLAVAAVTMAGLFIMADMGQPQRAFNILLHPTPSSILFWDMYVLTGYLVINAVIAWVCLRAEKSLLSLPGWVKPLIFLSIPWAIAIHTVTAFLYAGLPGRHLWLTAIMAPRFLASAFASGPAFLLILLFVVKKLSSQVIESEAVATLGKIMLYGMITNIFFYGLEFFTAFYSNIPDHKESLQYLFFGLDGHDKLVPWVRTSLVLGVISVIMLLFSKVRDNENMLIVSALLIFVSTYIDKGMALIIGGFIPSTLGEITEYTITWPELSITLGIWAIGFFLISVFFKMTIQIRKERA
ncbi:MAG: polysulfide reductase NrfD [Spirochaetia bacterium]|nr:polysulfide reductase NrfD [Spirochaetia bacterium]